MVTDTSKLISKQIKELLLKDQRYAYSTQGKIAEGIGINPKRFENLLGGRCEYKADDVKQIADFFGKTTDYFWRGTDEPNTTIASDLGLCNDAIEFLKEIASSDSDEPLPTGWSDGWTKEEEVTVTSPDELIGFGVDVEAVYPSEIRQIINYLLSEPSGKSLLSIIYKYVSIDPSSALAKTPARNDLENVSIPVDELLFSTFGNNHITSISVWAMPYAIKEMINIKLEEIKKELWRDIEK